MHNELTTTPTSQKTYFLVVEIKATNNLNNNTPTTTTIPSSRENIPLFPPT